jgi:hypothetical protein
MTVAAIAMRRVTVVVKVQFQDMVKQFGDGGGSEEDGGGGGSGQLAQFVAALVDIIIEIPVRQDSLFF